MIFTNISDFRKGIKAYFDRMAECFKTLIVNRGKISKIVLMPFDERFFLTATNYELSNKTNENRLDSAIEKLKKGDSFSINLIDE